MPDFQIAAHDDPSGVRVLAIEGEARLEVSERLTQEAIAALDGRKEPRVVLDLTGLEFLDSASTGALVRLQDVVEADRGGRFVLCGLRRVVRRVLDLTGLTSRFTVRPDRDQAIEYLAKD